MKIENFSSKNFTKWLLIVLVGLIFIHLTTLPVRRKLSNYFVEKGDKMLLENRYLSADLAYEKALFLSSRNKAAKERRKLVFSAATNITTLADYWREQKENEKINLLAKAQSVPYSETDAVRLSRNFLEQNQPQLAILPAKTATEMDPAYRDAWLYLGLANLRSAATLELTTETRQVYLSAAKSALERARSLDKTYKPILDLLTQIDSLTNNA